LDSLTSANKAAFSPAWLCRLSVGPIADPENTITQWASTFQINLFSLVSMLQHATPHLRSSENGGKVVMVSSGAATGNTSGWGCYNSSKVSEILWEGIANGMESR
jgi:NAD(P)-dependent dehydrogenase (short-subunit alcohol dehydrogenase family)